MFPVIIRIVHCNLASSGHTPGDNDDMLLPPPIELLELAIGAARVIYETGEIPHFTLEDLVWSFRGAANHNV